MCSTEQKLTIYQFILQMAPSVRTLVDETVDFLIFTTTFDKYQIQFLIVDSKCDFICHLFGLFFELSKVNFEWNIWQYLFFLLFLWFLLRLGLFG